MHNIKQHIIFKIATLAIVLALITPYVIKLSHAFNHHEHEICLGEQQTHMHEFDVDCDFYKFKTNSQFTYSIYKSEFVDLIINNKIKDSQYQSISKYQRLQCALRGPPQLV